MKPTKQDTFLKSIDILRLKQTISIQFKDHDSSLYIMYKVIIDAYPDKIWLEIEDDYFNNLPKHDTNAIIIYTILSYNLGKTFLSCPFDFIYDLIKAFIFFEISPFKLVKYTKIFLDTYIYSNIIKTHEKNLIPYPQIFNIVFKYLKDLELTPKNILEAKQKIKEYTEDFQINIFNENYQFFNIYTCLQKLISLSKYPEDTSILEQIPLFNTIQNEQIKKSIKRDFALIEKNNKSIKEKIKDCINIATKYSYNLPITLKNNN